MANDKAQTVDSQNIVILTSLIEESLGRSVKTPSDFAFLSGAIAERTRETLSVSTLKRIWGYVDGYDAPRDVTLSILSRFVGYRDWDTPVHGIFREYGVGNGTPRSMAGHSSRSMSDWLSGSLDKQERKLLDIVAEHEGDKVIHLFAGIKK